MGVIKGDTRNADYSSLKTDVPALVPLWHFSIEATMLKHQHFLPQDTGKGQSSTNHPKSRSNLPGGRFLGLEMKAYRG